MPITNVHRRQAEHDAQVLLESQEIRMDVSRYNRAKEELTAIVEKAQEEKKEKKEKKVVKE